MADITRQRLNAAWYTLYDLEEMGIPTHDMMVLREARHILHRASATADEKAAGPGEDADGSRETNQSTT